MPTDSERRDAIQMAAQHLKKMITLRKPVYQPDELTTDGRHSLQIGCADAKGVTNSRGGKRISSVNDWLPFEPYCMSFLLPLSNAVIEMFTDDAVQLRKLARITHCAVELQRTIVLRKSPGSSSWTKFGRIVIEGLTVRSILQMDSMMRKRFPVYLNRLQQQSVATQSSARGKPTSSACHLFVSESVPDNATLSFGSQRTGAIDHHFGALLLHQERKMQLANSDKHHANYLQKRKQVPSRTASFDKAASFFYSRGYSNHTLAAKKF